jgi:hypothetical protein
MNTAARISMALTLALLVPAYGQSAFQNLDFEAARVILVPPDYEIAATNALPGWRAFSGASELSLIPFNRPGIALPVKLIGPNSAVISGAFEVFLGGGGSISQAGRVPADAQLLLFKSLPSTPLLASLGGQNLSYAALSSGPNYTLYAADISAFAGQVVTLSLSAPPQAGLLIDDIEFVVPEPGCSGLGGLGGSLLALRSVWRRRLHPRTSLGFQEIPILKT